jgi:hypothetical protein
MMIGMAGGAVAAGWSGSERSGERFDGPETAVSGLMDRFRAEAGGQNEITASPVGAQPQAGPEKVKFGLVSADERNAYIAQASLWAPEESLNTAAIDFKSPPFYPAKYQSEELVTCKYVPMAIAYDGQKPSGITPKFKCENPKGKKLKVKYGQDNGEVITEVAASWILTAIGAYADRMYPVRLDCPDCPSDPFVSESDPGSWPGGSKVANSGIGFDEFHLINDRVGAEALTGLVHFFGNTDNKATNQAIACLQNDVVQDPAGGTARCRRPIVYLQDMGISFGGRGLYHNSRMNYAKWAAEKIWADPARCILQIRATQTSTLTGIDASGRDLHQIGEKARRMMVRRLSLLSRAQLADIFTAARAPEREPRHTAEEWADLFLSKVELLRSPLGDKSGVNFSCPYEVVPENSASNTGQPAR